MIQQTIRNINFNTSTFNNSELYKTQQNCLLSLHLLQLIVCPCHCNSHSNHFIVLVMSKLATVFTTHYNTYKFTVLLLCVSLLFSSYMFCLNYQHQGTDSILLKLTAIRQSTMLTYIECTG